MGSTAFSQSWWYIIIIFVSLLYITGSFSAPVRFTVEGFVGDSAVLFCSIPESEIQGKIEKISVHWRDDEGKKVCDITGGNRTCQDQDRVEMFHKEYEKGNFSIKLNRLQKTDARKYHCIITRDIEPHDTFQKEVITELHVKDKPEGKGNHGEPSFIVLLISFLVTLILPFL